MSPAAAVSAQIGVAVTAFVSTNIDGLLLLVGLYAGGRWRPTNIAMGQGLGAVVLVLASLAGAAGAYAAPPHWAGWLGLVPLALGVRGFLTFSSSSRRSGSARPPSAGDGRGQVLATTVLTLAGSGDNLGVYIPLFANARSQVPLYVAVFALMTLAWLALARWLASRPWGLARVRVLGGLVSPAVLTGIGVRMLAGALT